MNISSTKMLLTTGRSCLRHRHYSVVKQLCRVLPEMGERQMTQFRVPQIYHPQNSSCVSHFHTTCPRFEENSKGPEQRQQNVILRNWYSIMGGVTIFGVGLYYYALQRYKKQLQIEKALEVSEEVGEAKIALEEWELVDTNGKRFTNRDLLGKWCIFYFGFTHCPDICPDELDKLAATAKILEVNPSIPNIEVVFISVDPERDTTEIVKEYLNDFSKSFIGLTGTLEQVKKASRSYRVYFSKGKVDEDGDYIVDHSIITYLIDPKGKFVEFYSRTATAMEIANRVEKKMKEYSIKS